MKKIKKSYWILKCNNGFDPIKMGAIIQDYKSAKIICGLNKGGTFWHKWFPFIKFRANPLKIEK